jgi:hypothetical protein
MKKFMNLKSIAAVLVVAVATLYANAGVANIVTNPGFETNGGDGTDPPPWTADFNSFGAFGGAALTGSFGLHPGGGAAPGGRYQDLTTVAGTTYAGSAWVQNFADAAGSSAFGVVIGNIGGDSIGISGTGTSTGSLFDSGNIAHNASHATAGDGSWSEVPFQFTALGATTRLGLYNTDVGTVHSINIDDVSVTAVQTAPEPSSLILCVLGLVGLSVRRRRRQRC